MALHAVFFLSEIVEPYLIHYFQVLSVLIYLEKYVENNQNIY